MELPSRPEGDRLLRSGEALDIRRRLRSLTQQADLTAVIINAFDRRTRMLPFHYSATRIAPAGARAIGSALADSGIVKTRIVLQQWNPNVKASQVRIDGRIPDLLLVSSMQIHMASARKLLRDACAIDPAHRPLILAGGPLVIYEPWHVFSAKADDPWATDVAITGEEYVLLNLLEVLLGQRGRQESMRSAFLRLRDSGELDDVPGLVYARGKGPSSELANTGTQRLLGDLDELPSATIGFGLLEAPSRQSTLASLPLEASRVRRHSPIGSMVFTTGCKFSCPYCPIPAYNQRLQRFKSPGRIVEEMTQLNAQFGIRYVFGTDDNFFNDRVRATAILEGLAKARVNGRPLRRTLRWGTEVTVHDTLAMKDSLPLMRRAGGIALWLGVEDITATFVKKGQSVDKVALAFSLLRAERIAPVPMLMHHDGQPLLTPGKPYGLLNQIRMLRQAGAVDVQVLTMTPATGSRLYESAFDGQMIASAGAREVQPYMLDGNYAVASSHDPLWRMQLKTMVAWMYIYNPMQVLRAIVRPRSSRYLLDVGMQLVGQWGLLHTLPRMGAWMLRLLTGANRKCEAPPSHLPLVSVERKTESVMAK